MVLFCLVLFPFLYKFCSCVNDDFILGRKAVGSPSKRFREFTVILYHSHHNCLN
jgi:hypothetical protein